MFLVEKKEREQQTMERKMYKSTLFPICCVLFALFDRGNALYGSSSPVLQLTPSNFKSKVWPLIGCFHL